MRTSTSGPVATGAASRDVVICCANEVEPERLAAFYQTMYPGRPMVETWRWRYHVEEGCEGPPLVAVRNGRVIAHAGGVPFTAETRGQRWRAMWFVDFAVLPEHQRQGVGIELTERWMQLSDLHVTFCNEHSIGVFKKFGWVESFDMALHRLLLRPFDQPRAQRIPPALRSAGNALARVGLKILQQSAAGNAAPELGPVGEAELQPFLNSSDSSRKNIVRPIRDADYLQWRILSSPARASYVVCRLDDVALLVHTPRIQSSSRLDVLVMSSTGKASFGAIRQMLAWLGLWGLERGFEELRYFPPNKELSDYLARRLPVAIHRPRFAYHSAGISLLQQLQAADWEWQLLDSDFEWI
ncbi:MAG TPA: GNAT family N-acetyltransferase [Chloroflexota bacterium]